MSSISVTHAESTAVKQQAATGWRHLFNRCMSKMWSDIQDKYLQDFKLHTRCSNGASWANHCNEMCRGKNKKSIKEHQQESLLTKVEVLYMLKDRLLARDRNLMFSTLIEVSQFVNNHHTQYFDQWLCIWQPYFRQVIITETRRAIENSSLITSYFCCKTSTDKVFLPCGFQTINDRLVNEHPIGTIQTNLTAWITSDKPTSNL
eukprot:12045992-Ditylum_brightwellii.AAC.1